MAAPVREAMPAEAVTSLDLIEYMGKTYQVLVSTEEVILPKRSDKGLHAVVSLTEQPKSPDTIPARYDILEIFDPTNSSTYVTDPYHYISISPFFIPHASRTNEMSCDMRPVFQLEIVQEKIREALITLYQHLVNTKMPNLVFQEVSLNTDKIFAKPASKVWDILTEILNIKPLEEETFSQYGVYDRAKSTPLYIHTIKAQLVLS
jgi:hypothetical protein